MKYIYGFYRPERLKNSKDLWDISLNGVYDIPFYVGGQYEDWIKLWWMEINQIPYERHTLELAPWVKDLRIFISIWYDETLVNEETALEVVGKIGAKFDLVPLAPTDAIAWIKKHTDLVEESDWVFVINEYNDLETDEKIVKKLEII